MKTKLVLQSMGLLVIMGALIFVLSSCSKSANGNLTKEQSEMIDSNTAVSQIDEKDISETDEDLTMVDYKEFYEQLAPHGEWVQVKPEDIGMKPKPVVSKNSLEKIFTLSNLLGINDAYAMTDANLGMVFVWKPSPDLAVVSTVGETPVYRPYSNGQWVNSDAGWYYKAPTPYEETTSHYGRWVNSSNDGYLWVPGRVWSPAWVDWRQNDNYVSWAPLPPSAYMVDGAMVVPVMQEDNYAIVERKYFLEPNVYQYNNLYYDNGSRIVVSEMQIIPGIVLVNNVLVNQGPDVNVIYNIYGRSIETVRILHVRNFNDVRYSDREYNVYQPGFRRFTNHDNGLHKGWEPKSYKKYDDWKGENSGNRDNNKEDKKYDKKYEKKYEKKNLGDDRNMYNGNNNGKKHDGNDNGKKYNGNDNGKKYNGNDNGKKYNGNDNGKKDNGNDNGKKNNGNSNDNGKKNNGNSNDNGKKNNGNSNDNGKKQNDNGNKNDGGNDHGKGKK